MVSKKILENQIKNYTMIERFAFISAVACLVSSMIINSGFVFFTVIFLILETCMVILRQIDRLRLELKELKEK